MTEHPNATPKPPFRWGRVVLFVSLALNLADAGMVGGAVLGRFDHKRAEYAARDISFGLFSEGLSEGDRKALRRAYGEAKKDIRADRSEMREDLQAVLAALRTQPFDVATLRAALARGTERAAERQVLGQTLLLAHLESLTAAERAALADRVEQSLKRRSKRDRKPKDD